MEKLENRLKVKILVGIPASGKSTWSKNFVKENTSWVRVSRDDFRLMLKDSALTNYKLEKLITKLVDSVILESLKSGLNVIIDNTNLKESYIKHYFNLVPESVDIDFKIFDISKSEAIERDSNRIYSVGREVIDRMYLNYEKIMDNFFKNYKKG